MASPPQPPSTAVEDAAGRLVFEFRPRFRGGFGVFTAVFLSVWLVGWGFGLVFAVRAISSGEASATGLVFLLGWLGAWIVGGVVAAAALALGLGGREIVVLGHDGLSIRLAVGPLGYERRYEPSRVHDIRVLDAAIPGRSGFAVAFTYGDATVRFGDALERAAAEDLARSLSERLDAQVLSEMGRFGGADVMEFRPQRSWLGFSFVAFWLVAWVGGGLGAQHGFPGGWGGVAAFSGWLFFGVLVAAGIAHGTVGVHTARVTDGVLEIRRAIGPFGYTRRYDAAVVDEVRAVPVQTEDGPAEDDFEVAFAYGRKTVRFGLGLSRPAAEAAAAELAERLGRGSRGRAAR